MTRLLSKTLSQKYVFFLKSVYNITFLYVQLFVYATESIISTVGCFQIFHYPVKITASISQNDINCGRNLVVCKAILTRNGTSYVPSHGSCFHFSLDSGRPRAPCFRPHCESAILGGPDDRATVHFSSRSTEALHYSSNPEEVL